MGRIDIILVMEYSQQPLAYRMRPTTLSMVVGQQHLVGEQGFLTKMVTRQQLVSLIFYGPPGTGKTTMALCLANDTQHSVRFFNAVTGNKKDLTAIFAEAEMSAKPLVVIIDEVHRLNKDKQDLLLPYLENGSIILLGCTTANPYFAINPAIRSRCHCVGVHALSKDDVIAALNNALTSEHGLNHEYTLDPKAANAIASLSNGDIRYALNCLQSATFYCGENHIIDMDVLNQCNFIANSSVFKDDDGHYDAESALQKSIRGSDVNAALYYLARLIQANDLDSIERRLTVIAYEDIGLANPNAGMKTIIGLQGARNVGFPEARIILSQIVIDLALSPKSKSGEMAIDKAMEVVNTTSLQVPPYLQMTPVGLSEAEKYDYGDSALWPYIQYLPDQIKDMEFYQPQTNSTYEKQLAANYGQLKKIERSSDLPELKARFKKARGQTK